MNAPSPVAAPADRVLPGVLLRIRGLSKAFGATQAVREADFEILAGEVHALVGENGSGKSTLVKILSGVHAPDAGEIELFGEASAAPTTPKAAQRGGIMTVFQEVLVAESRSVLDNIWLGVDGLVRTSVSDAAKRTLAQDVFLRLLGREVDLDRPIGELSLSEQQACCIVRALLREPKVLILDEATSSLDVSTRDRLFAILAEQSREGVGVVFITHRMDELTEIGDRITVMRSGRTVGTLDRGAWTPDELVRLMTGSDRLIERDRGSAEPGAEEREPVLVVRGLRLEPGRRPVDVELRAGEVVGVAGLEGHGQHEFLEALRGAAGGRTGEIIRPGPQGESVIASVTDAAVNGIAYVPRERRAALFGWMSIRENFGMPTLGRDTRGGLLRPASTVARLETYVSDLGIVLGAPDDPITTLSGGNQQKVLLARWLEAEPRVLLLNDPTRGVDIGTKRQLYRVLTDLAGTGVAIVVLSTEVDEHVELMDRVLVFREHELSCELQRAELSRSSLVTAFFGQDAESADRPHTGRALTDEAGGGDPESAPAAAAPEPRRDSLLRLLRHHSFGFALLLTVGLVIANLAVTGNFNVGAQLVSFAPLAVAAMASTPAILSGGGGFDLSISPLMTLTAGLFSVWLVPNGVDGVEAIPVLLLAGALMGALNGLLILALRVPPIVVTLSTFFILIGVNLRVIAQPQFVEGRVIRGLIGGPTTGAVLAIAFPLVVWGATALLPYRRQLYAVGSNDATAFSSGVDVGTVRVLAYTLGGLLAAVGGIAVIAATSTASAGASQTYTLQAIAAVALGGTSLWGGRGGLLGSLLGAASIHLLGTLLVRLNIGPNWLQVMYGAMLLLAVVVLGAAARPKEAS